MLPQTQEYNSNVTKYLTRASRSNAGTLGKVAPFKNDALGVISCREETLPHISDERLAKASKEAPDTIEGSCVVLTESVGAMPILSADIAVVKRVMWRRVNEDDEDETDVKRVPVLLVETFDQSTGVISREKVLASKTCVVTHLFGQPICSRLSALELTRSTHRVLTIHYARRAIVTLLNNTPTLMIRELGGAKKILDLLKVTAASEQVIHQSIEVAKKRSHLVRSLCEKIIEIVKKEEERSSDMDSKEMEIEELDSKDEEELRLSDTLIRECIEHLSSVNKTNRHEEDDTGDVVMFESLHPYFDKSSYGRTLCSSVICSIEREN